MTLNQPTFSPHSSPTPFDDARIKQINGGDEATLVFDSTERVESGQDDVDETPIVLKIVIYSKRNIHDTASMTSFDFTISFTGC